jgi:hypothetical protein
LLLESLEDRIAPALLPTDLSNHLSELSGGLSRSFAPALAPLTGNVPLVGDLVAQQVLQQQLDPIVTAVQKEISSELSANPNLDLQTFVQNLSGNNALETQLQFFVSGYGESSGTAQFDITFKPSQPPVNVNVTQNVNFGPFTLTVGGANGVSLLNQFSQVSTHVALTTDSISVEPDKTVIDYAPQANTSITLGTGNSIGGVKVTGTVGFNLASTINAAFLGGANFVSLTPANSSVPLDTANTVSTNVLALPLDVQLNLGDLPSLEYKTAFQYDLDHKDQGFTHVAGTEEILFNGVVLQKEGDANATGSDDTFTRAVLTTAARPIFQDLQKLIPQKVVDFFEGTTPVFGGVQIKDLLGGLSPLTVAGDALDALTGSGGTPLIAVIQGIVDAVNFAQQIEGKAPVNGSNLATGADGEKYGKDLGVTFPIIDDPLPHIEDILAGKPTQLVDWSVNTVVLMNNYLKDNGVPPDVIAKLDKEVVQPDGKTIKIDLHQLANKLTNLFGDALKSVIGNPVVSFGSFKVDVVDTLSKALSWYFQELLPGGQFSLYFNVTAGVDSTFLTDPSLNGIANSVFIDSGTVLDFQLDNFGFDFPFGSGGLGLYSVQDLENTAATLDPTTHSPGQLIQNIGDAIAKGGQGALDAIKQGVNDAGQFIIDAAHKLADFIANYQPNGELAATVSGNFSIALPDGKVKPGELTAPEFLSVLGDPLNKLLYSGSIDAAFTAVLNLGSTHIFNAHPAFHIDFGNTSSVSGGGVGGGSTGSQVLPGTVPFAEVNPTTRVLQVYGSGDDDVFTISEDNNHQVKVEHGGAFLTFNEADFDSVVVDLRGGVLTPINGAAPAGGGNDKVNIDGSLAGRLSVTVWGGDGADSFTANDGQGGLFGGTVVFHAGNVGSTLVGGAGSSYLYGGSGDDTLIAGAGYNYMVGGPGNNVLEGPGPNSGVMPTTSSRGVMIGGPGTNLEYVGTVAQGPWTLIGGSVGGTDAGSAILVAGQGDTTLIAGNALLGADGLYTGRPNTGKSALLIGGPGNDILYGGAGNNTLIGGGVNSTVPSGNATIYGGNGPNLIIVGNATTDANGNIIPDTTTPGSGAAYGGLGSNTFYAANGPTLLVGGPQKNAYFVMNPATGVLAAGATIFVAGNGQPGEALNILDGGGRNFQTTYTPGPQVGAGRVVTTDGTATQTISFTGLAPVHDNVPAGNLTVNGTPASNAINYTAGPGGGIFGTNATGLVTVDDQESYEFSQKTSLVINGLAGSDTFNLNFVPKSAKSDQQPTGLTGMITVNGNDPTGAGAAADTLVANGVLFADGTTSKDAIDFSPTGTDAGSITGAGSSRINFGGIEQVQINGHGGNDSLTVTTPTDGATVTYTPGTAVDSASVQVGSLVPLRFTNLGAAGTVTVANGGGGSSDTLVYNGTPAADKFTVAATTINGFAAEAITLNNQIAVNAPGTDVSNLRLNGLGGDDTFGLAGGLPYASTVLDGGEPSASDIVSLSGATGPVTANLGDSSVPTNTTVTGYGGTVTLIGVEVANLDTGGNALTVAGTARNDTITYTPTGASAGTFQNAGLNTVFNFANVGGAFTVNGGGGTADQVVVNGSAGRDLFSLRADLRTATVTDASGTALQPVTLGNGVQVLTANGLGGRDTFQVTPAAGIQFPPDNLDNLLINVNGSATGANSALVVQSAAGGALDANQFVIVNRGAAPNSGTVRVYTAGVQWPDINYQNVQVVAPNVAGTNLRPNLLVMGPDLYEPNDQQGNATLLGAGATLQIQHASIFPNGSEFPGAPADQDYYQVVAQQTGTLDFQVHFRVFDPALLPAGGNLNLEVLDAAGNVIATAVPANFGAAGTTADARVRIPAVAGQSYFLHVFGANPGGTPNPDVVNGYDATILNTAPPAPFNLELSRSVPAGVAGSPDTGALPTNAPGDDSGRNQFDNVTNDATPRIYIRLSDAVLLNDLPGNGTTNTPPAGVIPIPFSPNSTTPGFRVALFDGNDTQNPIGFATPVAGFPGLYQVDLTTPLADGLHHLTAAVQMVDPATPTETGFGPASAPLDLTIDTAAPPVKFGNADDATDNGLDAGSDSGVSIDQATLADRVTNVTNPTFFGAAEANSVIRVFAVATAGQNAGQDVLIGQTVATPLDGTNAFPNGRWSVQSNINLNDPRFFTPDGTRTIHVTAEDLAGNVSASSTMLIFVDTQGPNVTNVQITGHPAFNLFALKPVNFAQGPTPLVHGLTIRIADLPNRDATNFPNYVALDALADTNPGLFSLVGDQVGVIPISQVIVTNDPPVDGQPATATIQLVFADQRPGDQSALPDDRYTLTINDRVVDPAGNRLDGESNASMPFSAPTFPSGNGVPGGNFVARFTVDSRPHIGITNDGQELDINGNGVWDPVNAKDATNSDKAFRFGLITDTVFAGNFAPTGASGTGFSELGAYGMVNGQFRWLLTFNGVAEPDYAVVSGLQVNGLPVAYHFNPAVNADEIAVFDGLGNWYIDYNHTNNLTPGNVLVVHDGLRGYPVVGDFDGDGNFDLATYQPDTDTWQFDLDPLTAHRAFTSLHFGFPGVLERPVAADMNRDGVTDIGLFVPTSLNRATTPGANWYFLVSDITKTPPVTGTVNTLDHPFNPTPFSHDLHYYFGNGFFEPVVGTWDPPAPAAPPPLRLAPGAFGDVSVTAEVGAVPVGGLAGLVARRSANGQNEYWAGLTRTAKGYLAQIARVVNGSWQTLVSVPVAPASGANVLRFEAVGTSLDLYLGGQLVASAADAAVQGAGGAGTYASAGSVVWPPRATALPHPAVALPFADGFGQANGTLLGAGWDQWLGSVRVSGGAAVGQAAADVATLHGASAADVSVSADVTAVPAGGFAGLLSRHNAATGDTYRAGLAAAYDPKTKAVTYAAQVWRKQGGQWLLLAAQPVTAGTGHLTFVTVSASEELFLNGTLVVVAADGTLKTGAAGLYATQGAALDNFAAGPVTFATTSLPFSDNFSGAVPGPNWYSNQGGFAVSGGALAGRAGSNVATLYGVAQQNVSVQGQLLALPAGAAAGLLARYNTATGNTYWAGLVSSYDPRTKVTSYAAQIRRRINGTWTVLFSTTAGAHPGLLRFDVSGSQLSLSLDGTLLGTVRDGTLAGAGTVGLSGDQGSRFGSFSAH